jgi:hypothetical protein
LLNGLEDYLRRIDDPVMVPLEKGETHSQVVPAPPVALSSAGRLPEII